jgi:putative intracellular protease/amidase
MRLSIVVFDGFTALDIIGGYEVLARLPGIDIEFVAEKSGTVAADTRRLGIIAYRDFVAAKGPEVLYVPGGPGVGKALQNAALMTFVRESHATSAWTIGICNGVEILGAAGALAGKTVTTNFFARKRVEAHGAHVLPKRFHRDGKIVTGAGVSASIDAAFFLAGQIAGEPIARVIQLGLEYYPDPPFPDPKTVDEASEETKALVLGFEEGGASAAMLRRVPPF